MDSKAIFQLIMWLVKVSLLLSSWYTGVGLTDAPRFYRAVLLIVLKIGIYVVYTWHNDDLLWCENCIKSANHCTFFKHFSLWNKSAYYWLNYLSAVLIPCLLTQSHLIQAPTWQCFRTRQSISQISWGFFLGNFY